MDLVTITEFLLYEGLLYLEVYKKATLQKNEVTKTKSGSQKSVGLETWSG